jgi:hypothetical protein
MIGLRDPKINPPKVRKILESIGNEKITSIKLIRTPLSKVNEFLLNIASFGQLKDKMKDANIDKLFHLSMLINNKYQLEKNDVIMLTNNPNAVKKDSETLDVNVSKDITINELLTNTQKKMGVNYGPYDAKTNNCSVFLSNVLTSNGLNNSNANNFINQKTIELFKSFPSLTEKIVKTATTAAAVVNKLVEGEGRPRRLYKTDDDRYYFLKNRKRKYIKIPSGMSEKQIININIGELVKPKKKRKRRKVVRRINQQQLGITGRFGIIPPPVRQQITLDDLKPLFTLQLLDRPATVLSTPTPTTTTTTITPTTPTTTTTTPTTTTKTPTRSRTTSKPPSRVEIGSVDSTRFAIPEETVDSTTIRPRERKALFTEKSVSPAGSFKTPSSDTSPVDKMIRKRRESASLFSQVMAGQGSDCAPCNPSFTPQSFNFGSMPFGLSNNNPNVQSSGLEPGTTPSAPVVPEKKIDGKGNNRLLMSFGGCNMTQCQCGDGAFADIINLFNPLSKTTTKVLGLGKDVDGLYNDEIEKITDKIGIDVPVISSDEIDKVVDMINPKTKEFGFVINVVPSDSDGSGKDGYRSGHWMSVFINNADDLPSIEFFDPLGDGPSPDLIDGLEKIVKKIDSDKLMLFKENMIQRQSDDTNTCGHHAIKFLEDRFNGIPWTEATGFDKCMNQQVAGEKEIQKSIKKYEMYI